jgi:hypothetical protein
MSHDEVTPRELTSLKEDILTLSYAPEHETLVRKLAQRFLLCNLHVQSAEVIVEASKQAGVLTIRYPQGYEPLASESIHTWLEAAQTCGLIDSYGDTCTEGAGEHFLPLFMRNQAEDAI